MAGIGIGMLSALIVAALIIIESRGDPCEIRLVVPMLSWVIGMITIIILGGV